MANMTPCCFNLTEKQKQKLEALKIEAGLDGSEIIRRMFDDADVVRLFKVDIEWQGIVNAETKRLKGNK